MATKAKMSKKKATGKLNVDVRAARLELIRKRHRALILNPRESLAAAELDCGFDDALDDQFESEELRLQEAFSMDRI
jgi:hypothetical protein